MTGSLSHNRPAPVKTGRRRGVALTERLLRAAVTLLGRGESLRCEVQPPKGLRIACEIVGAGGSSTVRVRRVSDGCEALVSIERVSVSRETAAQLEAAALVAKWAAITASGPHRVPPPRLSRRERTLLSRTRVQQKAAALEAEVDPATASEWVNKGDEWEAFLCGVAVGKIRNRDQRAPSKPAA